MEEMNQATVAGSSSSSNGKVILGIVVVLAIAAAMYFMGDQSAPKEDVSQTPATVEKQDTTEVINKQIESVNVEALDASLDTDLKAIDDQLNSL